MTFYVRAWIVSGKVGHVQASTAPIKTTISAPDATAVDAIVSGEYRDAAEVMAAATWGDIGLSLEGMAIESQGEMNDLW